MSPVKSQGRANARERAKPNSAKNGSQKKDVSQNASKAKPLSKVPNEKQRGRESSSSPEVACNRKNKSNGASQPQQDKKITTKLKPPPKAPERVGKLPAKPENKRSDTLTESDEVESESEVESSVEATEEETSDEEKEEHLRSKEESAETQESEQSSEEEAGVSGAQRDTEQTANKESDEELSSEAKSRSDSAGEPVASSTEEEEDKKEVEASEAVISERSEDDERNQEDVPEKPAAVKPRLERRPTPRPSNSTQRPKRKMFKKTKADVQAEKAEKKKAKAEKQRLEKEAKQKAKEEKKNKKKQKKEDRPRSSAEESQPLKGGSVKKNDTAKGKSKVGNKTKKSSKKDVIIEGDTDTEEEEVKPSSSKNESQNQMNLKAKGKDQKAALEPKVQGEAERTGEERPQSLLLGKADVDTESEVITEESGKPTERLIARTKGMRTLRRVSGWIQKKMPKGFDFRKKLSAWTKAIGVSRWLSFRAIKQKQNARKSKSNILKHRMRAVSKTSLASRKNRSSSNNKMVSEKASPQEKAEEGEGEPAPAGEKEVEAKYAVVLPRMNKLTKDRQAKTADMPQAAPEPSTSASTIVPPEEPSTSDRKPPKPGARLVLPVKPDLNLLKSIQKPLPGGLASNGAGVKSIPVSSGPKGLSNTKGKDGRTAPDNKNGASVLQSARGLDPSQINLTRMSLSGGMISGGLTRAKGPGQVRDDAAGMPRSTNQAFPSGETAVTSSVQSLYEEETDREVAQLMGEGGVYTINQPEVHWAGNPRMSGDPQVCVSFLNEH